MNFEHREQPQARDRQTEQVGVGVTEELPRPLGRRVGADRLIDRIGLGKRDLAVVAVHAGAGSEQDPPA
jgi:hypothetical protein